MSRFNFRLPDLGEGTVSAEIVAWLVKAGDWVTEGQPIAEMSTDKAVVELPAPVSGRVVARQGEPGDSIAVGAELISFDVEEAPTATPVAAAAGSLSTPIASAVAPPAPASAAVPASTRVMASPATRRRAREAGVDLGCVPGTGPGGRIRRQDLETVAAAATVADPATVASAARSSTPAGVAPATEEIRVIGVRRIIAQRLSEAKRTIPHFSYVEECDVTELETLRRYLNGQRAPDSSLSLLPFVVAALTRVLARYPQCNAHYDAAREVIVRYRAVHVGIATQTPDGLKVPVVRDAQSLDLAALAAEIRRVAEAARSNRASRELLSGSTITVTSLGKLGGLASTPIINAPEVAIIGVNRMLERPVVREGAIVIRQMVNLSSSFDHRFVDGFDAAAMIQALKQHLEHPATLFMPDEGRLRP